MVGTGCLMFKENAEVVARRNSEDFPKKIRDLERKQQRETEKSLILKTFGSDRKITDLDMIDVNHLMANVSIVSEWGANGQRINIASCVSTQVYNAVRSRGYDWRGEYGNRSVIPQMAIYLDCLARLDEIQKTLQPVREGGHHA